VEHSPQLVKKHPRTGPKSKPCYRVAIEQDESNAHSPSLRSILISSSGYA